MTDRPAWIINRIADLILQGVRDEKTLARVRGLDDGRLVIWPEDLQAALSEVDGD